MKRSIPQLVSFLVLCLFSLPGISQTITLDFPNDLEVCEDMVTLDVTVLNDTGSDIDTGMIAIDLSAIAGVTYLGFTQTAGPTITEDVAGVPNFSFDPLPNPLPDGMSLTFSLQLMTDCTTAASAAPAVTLNFDYRSILMDFSTSETLSGITIIAPDIEITSSAPIGITGVIGYEFAITNTVENNGTADAENVYYCVEDNTNATLQSLEVGMTSLAPVAGVMPGFTCFDLSVLPQAGMVDVVENWVITSCSAPIQNLFRRASYGCNMDFDCSEEPDSDFPSTVLTLAAPALPIAISITNASELSVCGVVEIVCIDIENIAGSGFVTRNTKVAFQVPAGLGIDLSALVNKSGPPVSVIPGTDSLLIGDFEDNEITSFSLEVQAICGAESNALDFIVDVVYDELCEGEATIVSETSNQISILSALFTILSSEIEGNLGNDNVFDAILGEVDTLKVPLNNASSGSIDSFVYYVVNPGPFVGGVGPVEIENVLIEGVPLEVLGTNGDTTFYAITGPNILDSHSPGGLGIGMTVDEVFDENEQLIICEVWRGTRCEFGTIDPGIQRQAYYGCGGVEACSRSNLSVSGVNYSFAAPDLTYSEYKDLSVRPACYSDESTTLGSKIVNIGNSIAKDITISIDQGGRPGVILGGSFMYSSSPTGPFISVPAINTVGPIASSCLSGPGRFNEADAFLEDINLPAGDSIYFTYDLEFGCDCSACSIQDIYGSTITQMQFTDPCDLEFVNNDNIDYIDFDARLEGFFEGESLVSGSSCFTYQITSGTASWMRNRPDLCMGDDFYPDAYFESVFVVDCGIDITSVTYTDNDGVESADLIVSNVDKGAGGQDSVVTRIPYNVAGTFNICFNLDCDEKGPCTQTASIRLDNYFITADCPSGCAPNVNCTDVFTTSFGCPGCLPCDGLSAVDLEINRTNYCYLDADDDFIPDDGSLADQTTAKSKRFVQGDSLRLEIISVIRDEMGPASFWDYAFLELDVQATDYTIVGGEFSVYDSSSMATLTCNSLSQFDDSGTFVTDVSVPSMTGLGCIDFAGFHYAEGDSLCLTVIFSPKDELFNVQSAPVIYSPIFYLSDAPYGMGSRESCNNLFETLNQIGITEREIVSIEGRDFGGCDLSPFVIRYDLHYGSLRFDEFCGEIRSPGIPEKFTFVKPSELEYSLDDFGMNVLQRMDGSTVVNQQSGGIPPGFFLESGDTLCFFVKDYLATLPDGELTDKGTDGGYSINFYPGIRGNCMTDSELMYEAGAQLITDVDDQVFCQDTIMTALEFESFEYTGGPVLVASTSMPNVELLESSACVEIELTNLTLINAPFSWIDIQSMTGGLIVTSVTETTGGMSNVITPSQFGIYELGTTADEATRTFEICVNTTNCDPQTLSFVGGWDCSAYPETLEEATCNDPSTINFTTAESAYTGQLVKPTIGEEYDLCDTICFIYRISSNSFGNINDIIYDFRLPGGVDYVHGSFEIAYPVPTTSSMLDTNWVFVTDPANTFDNNYQINVSDLDMTLMNDGLIGTFGATTNTNIILVRWNAVTTCDFISGSRARFSVNAKDACNDDLPTLRSRGPRMRIRNLFPDYEINLSSTDLTLNPCNEDGATTNIQMQISADPGIETSDMDSIKITLPEGISYQAMSYNPITNATAGDPLVVFENDSTCLYIPIQEGLENGDFVSFDIDIVANDVGQLCGNYEMIVQTFSSTNAMCGMEECSIGVLSGEDFINISIEKPDLSIITTDLTIVSMPPASAGIDYEIKIMNNGLVPQDASNNLNIEFWDDVDANGLLDPMIDDLVIVTSEIVTIPAGGMTLITGSSPIPPTGICQALVVLNPESTCVCNLEVSNQTSVTIENMFDMEVEVCSGAMVDIGPELVAGFDYKWLSVNGSNLGALSSETTSPTTLQFTNNTGSDIVWDYAVRSSYGSCYTYDTVQVTIFPATMSEATVTACLDGSVALPGPVDGFDFMWTPITGLDDPTSNSPILDPVLMGVNTYNLSYIDGNGCGASKEVIIVGAGCTDGTAIGDTVWFDFNEDGLQDPGEPGIPNVTVYLYTASNTTPGNHIAFTMTDANGFYIFDNLTAGNYIIEFVSPSGFVYTLDNVVGKRFIR